MTDRPRNLLATLAFVAALLVAATAFRSGYHLEHVQRVDAVAEVRIGALADVAPLAGWYVDAPESTPVRFSCTGHEAGGSTSAREAGAVSEMVRCQLQRTRVAGSSDAPIDVHRFFANHDAWTLAPGGHLSFGRDPDAAIVNWGSFSFLTLTVLALAAVPLWRWDWRREWSFMKGAFSGKAGLLTLSIFALTTACACVLLAHAHSIGARHASGMPWVFIGVSSLLVAPVVEEVLCRGLIQGLGARLVGPIAAGALGVVFFVAMHERTIGGLLYVALVGILIATAFHYGRSLVSSILIHAFINAAALVSLVARQYM